MKSAPKTKRARGISRLKATDEEALAIAALRALLSAPPERAVPLIERTLSHQKSDLVKGRALLVLGQIGTPAAQVLLLKNAQQLKGPLQLEAIRAIGISGDPASLKALLPLHQAGTEAQQNAVILALGIADNSALLSQLATMTSVAKQREAILMRLASMGAVAELNALAKQGIAGINMARAYAIAGDLDGVLKIARGDADPAVRIEAIRSLGMIRKEPARQALQEIYQSTKLAEEKSAALSGLHIARDEKRVLSLYRSAQTAEEKRELLRVLGWIGGDAALEAIDAALEGKQP